MWGCRTLCYTDLYSWFAYRTFPVTIYSLRFVLRVQACEALRLTLTQKVLQKENFSPFENLYFICPVACFCQAPALIELLSSSKISRIH